VEKEHSKNNKDFTSNDSGNCTERRSYLGVSDKHEHKCARRSNLDDAHTYTRRPERRLHVKEAREHMHARRSDLGDTRKHEPERSKKYNLLFLCEHLDSAPFFVGSCYSSFKFSLLCFLLLFFFYLSSFCV
jgi:hypothetical protein